jgi:hypothetical protein
MYEVLRKDKGKANPVDLIALGRFPLGKGDEAL